MPFEPPLSILGEYAEGNPERRQLNYVGQRNTFTLLEIEVRSFPFGQRKLQILLFGLEGGILYLFLYASNISLEAIKMSDRIQVFDTFLQLPNFCLPKECYCLILWASLAYI